MYFPKLLHFIAVLLALVLLPQKTYANDIEGAWSEVFEWPITAIHMSLLHTGHIVLWTDTDYGEPQLLDATNDCFDDFSCFTPKPTPVNVFCAGHSHLSDGSLLVSGGHVGNNIGEPDTLLFQHNKETNDWNWTSVGELPNSKFTRWYPTLTTLPDGRVLNVSGSEKRCSAGALANQLCVTHSDCGAEEAELCEIELVGRSEVFDPATREWTLLTDDVAVQFYPFNFVAPSGDVYFAGADSGPNSYDIAPNEGAFIDVVGDSITTTGNNSVIDGGSAVMYRPGQILKCGGTENLGVVQTTTAAEIIDLNGAATWSPTGSLNNPRRRHNSVVLPDGTVLVSGGTRLGNNEFETDGTCGGTVDGATCQRNNQCDEDVSCLFNPTGDQQWVAQAEIWDPDTGGWTAMASNQRPRLYHSTLMLLPDGRVISAGGGPKGYDSAINTYTDAEIYSPPYLFSDTVRPVIDQVPEIIYYGNAFELLSEQAADVSQVNLIRLGAVTHSFDQDTRFVPLNFVQGLDGQLDVQAPSNPNIAPPGYYMVFAVSSDGFPSEAKFVRVLPLDPGGDALFEYSAKIVCGREEIAEDEEEQQQAQRAPGFYSTSVNIHNPGPGPVRFFKKLALTSPPGFQVPGKIIPIGEDVLKYDEALQTDCLELRQKVISTAEAETIEGFLVVQSPSSLDVTSVYTTASNSGEHSSIDVEQVAERLKNRADVLVEKRVVSCEEIDPIDDVPPFCDFDFNFGDTRQEFDLRLFSIEVTNIGPDIAQGLVLDDELMLDFPAGVIGATTILAQDPIVLPTGASIISATQIDDVNSNMQISLPDLAQGETHEVMFWTISVSYWIPSADFTPNIQLRDTAEIEVSSIDTNPLNNSVTITDQLNP